MGENSENLLEDVDTIEHFPYYGNKAMATKTINGVRYIITVDPDKYRGGENQYMVSVYHMDEVPDHPRKTSGKRRLAYNSAPKSETSIERLVSITLNEAISRFESKLEEQQRNEDAILAALEVTKEVHEDELRELEI